MELEVVAKVSRFGPDDPRTLDETANLIEALQAVVPVQTPPPPTGMKGTGETAGTVLVLVTALQQTPYLVEALKVWLARDRGHRVELRWRTSNEENSLEINATNLDSGKFGEMVERAWRQIEPPQ